MFGFFLIIIIIIFFFVEIHMLAKMLVNAKTSKLYMKGRFLSRIPSVLYTTMYLK